MVAKISLYRRYLHRAPDIPRRWLMRTPHISLKDFKSLLHRRNKALSRLRSSNPNPDLKPHISPMPNGPPIELKLEAQAGLEPPEDMKTGPPPEEGKVEVIGGSDGGDCSVRTEHEQPEKDDNLQVDEKLPEETKANIEVAYPSRASIGVSVSPSCFASTGSQGLLRNPPAVSVSGTNFVASSPSLVASGGTSVFKEARQPSPWN